MRIDCYLSMGCDSEEVLRRNVSEALTFENIDAEVNFHRIAEEEAEKLGLRGSPTILFDGVDPFPSQITGFS